MWDNDIYTIEKDGRPSKGLALLEGFKIKGDGIKIGPILIRNLEKEDEELFAEKNSLCDHAVLEFSYLDKKDVYAMYCDPKDIMEKSFQAIQLMIDNWIGMSEIIFIDDKGKKIGGVGFTRNSVCDAHLIKRPIINSDDTKFVENFKFLFEKQGGELDHVIKRYGKGCAETALESIVDFVIVLEATLGYKLSTEISHRVASRGALLLADDDKRFDYYKVLKYLYNIRSGIVHGNLKEMKALTENIRTRFESLGFLEGEAGSDFYKKYEHYILADIARKIAQKILLLFINEDAELNEDWLTKLELSCAEEEDE